MPTTCPSTTACELAECRTHKTCVLTLPLNTRLALLSPPQFPYPLRRDSKPRLVWPQGVLQ